MFRVTTTICLAILAAAMARSAPFLIYLDRGSLTRKSRKAGAAHI